MENLKVNKQGGIYDHGKAKSTAEKATVAALYIRMQTETGTRVTKRQLAKAAKVSPGFALKVINEIKAGEIQVPKIHNRKKRKATNFGGRTLNPADKLLLLQLREEMPGRSLADYQYQLSQINKKVISTSTISDWFLYCNEFRGSMKKMNPVPIAKYSARNKARFELFKSILEGLDPSTFTFVDEKALKAMELFGNKTRRCPITGEQPDQLVPKDFRVRWAIIGLIGFNMPTPMSFHISQENTTAETFMQFIVQCIVDDCFQENDVLILDNAPWHTKGAAKSLKNLLWKSPGPNGRPLHVLVVFLPTYCAELNPIELVWNIFLNKHRDRILYQFRDKQLLGENSIAFSAIDAMKAVTIEDIHGCYRHCGYLE